MKQYCRYCANCMQRDEDLFICLDDKQHTPLKWMHGKAIRRQNKCGRFNFNEISVDDPNTIYKPIEQRRAARPATHEQISLLEEEVRD